MKKIAATILLLAIAAPAASQGRPDTLVCFEQSGLIKSLDGVVNMQQFLRNDSTLRNGSCDLAQVPLGSTARYLGIHASPNGFLYPLYRVTYATTGQRMFAADGIFRADQWRVKKIRGTKQFVIEPLRCDTLDGVITINRGVPKVAKYISVPDICDIEVVQ